MHQQVKTSPRDARGNLAAVVDALADAGISIEAIAPDFESPHIRTVVDEQHLDQALAALGAAGLDPIVLPAIPFDLANSDGQLRGVLVELRKRGYEVDSVLIGATHAPNGLVRVSIGVKEPPRAAWESEANALAEEILASL